MLLTTVLGPKKRACGWAGVGIEPLRRHLADSRAVAAWLAAPILCGARRQPAENRAVAPVAFMGLRDDHKRQPAENGAVAPFFNARRSAPVEQWVPNIPRFRRRGNLSAAGDTAVIAAKNRILPGPSSIARRRLSPIIAAKNRILPGKSR